MVAMNTRRVVVFLVGTFIVLFILVFAFLVFGLPIHDFNLWRLSKRYESIVMFHPVDTVLIERKKYLGGPWDHSSPWCTYAIGEIRQTRLTRQEILNAYKNVPEFTTGKRPTTFKIFFPDSESVPMESPIGEWFGHLRSEGDEISSTGQKYLIYVAQEKVPYLGDMRCRGW